MKVLITGAAGQVGQSLQDTVPDTVSMVATDVGSLNLTDRHALLAGLKAAKPDLIINAGAYTAVDKAESEPEVAERVNGKAVTDLAAYCAATDCRLLQISTDFVFGGDRNDPWPVDAIPDPLNVYARTKHHGEEAALGGCDSSCVVRTSWVYSEYGNNFVKTMLRVGQSKPEISVVDDQIGSPTYARGLAELLWRIAFEWPDERILHYSDNAEISWHEFAIGIFKTAHDLGILSKVPAVRPVSTTEYAAPAARPAYGVLDTSLTKKLYSNICPDWEVALQTMLRRLVKLQSPT